MATDGTINYQYPILQQGVSDMLSKNNQITAQIEELASQVKNVTAGWTGPTADNYRQCANKISSDLFDSTATLHATAGSVNDGADALEQRDRSLSSLF